MLRLSRCFLAGFVFFLSLLNNIPSEARPVENYVRVLSVVKDAGGSYLVFNTTCDTTLQPPAVHYYPQADGTTVMAADFPGLLWNQQPQVVATLPAPIKEIHVGQFQTNPPICRIAVVSSSALALTKVSFHSASGVLAISWKAPQEADIAGNTITGNTNIVTAALAPPATGDDRNPVPQSTTTVQAHVVQIVPAWKERVALSSFRNANLLKGVNIVLDAGHGGSDPGAQRGTIQEKAITMGIVEKLYKMLVAQGARVTLTRSDDTFISVQDRVKLSLDAHPGIFLSVHINSLETDNDIHGIETYYRTEQSLPLAQCVHDALVSGLPACDRGVRSARFYVINHTPIPSILAEVGFISNPEERMSLATYEYQGKIANALKDGLETYLVRLKEEGPTLAKSTTSYSTIAASAPECDAGTIPGGSESGTRTLPVSTVTAYPASGRVGNTFAGPPSSRIGNIANPALIPHI